MPFWVSGSWKSLGRILGALLRHVSGLFAAYLSIFEYWKRGLERPLNHGREDRLHRQARQKIADFDLLRRGGGAIGHLTR